MYNLKPIELNTSCAYGSARTPDVTPEQAHGTHCGNALTVGGRLKDKGRSGGGGLRGPIEDKTPNGKDTRKQAPPKDVPMVPYDL